MNKQSLLKLVNVLLGINLLCIVITIILRENLLIDYFYSIHPFFGFGLLILICTHIVLNWNWIKSNYFKKKKKTQNN